MSYRSDLEYGFDAEGMKLFADMCDSRLNPEARNRILNLIAGADDVYANKAGGLTFHWQDISWDGYVQEGISTVEDFSEPYVKATDILAVFAHKIAPEHVSGEREGEGEYTPEDEGNEGDFEEDIEYFGSEYNINILEFDPNALRNTPASKDETVDLSKKLWPKGKCSSKSGFDYAGMPAQALFDGLASWFAAERMRQGQGVNAGSAIPHDDTVMDEDGKPSGGVGLV